MISLTHSHRLRVECIRCVRRRTVVYSGLPDGVPPYHSGLLYRQHLDAYRLHGNLRVTSHRWYNTNLSSIVYIYTIINENDIQQYKKVNFL